MRTYETTHPWITFELNLRDAPYSLWMLLGEAQSKSQHLAEVPLLPEVAEYFHRVFLAKGVLATTAIEGNTLTQEEVEQIIEGTLELPPSKQYLQQEIDNVVEACNLVGKKVMSEESPKLSVENIKAYNRLVLRDLPGSSEVNPGEIRKYGVEVGRYRGAPAEDCEYLLERLCTWINEGFTTPPGNELAFGILKAIAAHLYIAWIHPFGDGNGRTARLIELYLLLSIGVPSTGAHLLSNHYNQTRSEYYRQLELSHRNGGNVIPFICYALQGLIDGQKEQIISMRNQQLYVHLRNHIYNQFKDRDSATDRRKRRLALDLMEEREPIRLSKLRYLTPRLAEAYANKTDKTIERDVDELIEMGLVKKSKKGITVNRRLVLAFLPPTKNETH